jgi:lipopolysaccharide/colanic/teichoic acid biosynthesis glycosyltransferase
MKTAHLRNQILAADLAWIPLALAGEQALCSGAHCRHEPLSLANFVVYSACAAVAWLVLSDSDSLHLDGFRSGWRMSALVSHLLLAVVLLVGTLLAIESLSQRYIGRFTLSVYSLLLFMGFLAIRGLALRRILERYRNGDVHRVVILGSDRLASELAAKFNHHPELLCEVIGFLCPEAEMPTARSERGSGGGPSSVSTMDVVGLLHRHKIDELVMAHTPVTSEILNLLALCRERAIQVSLVPQPYELYLSRPSLLNLGGLPLLQLGEITPPTSARIGKRLLDVVLGSVLALVALPIILVCGAVLRLSTGSAFRRERRIGWQGNQFSMLRLNVDRDPQQGSRFHRMLWQVSISELPQFWNILRGEMSLVGPRPEGPERAHCYSAWQQQRLLVKPGMTGLAQVHGLRERHSSEDKTRHDLQYMLHPTPLKDLSLLIETIWTLASRLISLPGQKIPGSEEEMRVPQSVLYSLGAEPFSETLQHAHRTQSGSD